MAALIMTPISSHTLTNRPLVLPADSRVDVTLRSVPDEVYVTIDGQVGKRLSAGDRVEVRKSARLVQLVAPTGKGFFDVLRDKLKWG
jgi:NAD+ kinase